MYWLSDKCSNEIIKGAWRRAKNKGVCSFYHAPSRNALGFTEDEYKPVPVAAGTAVQSCSGALCLKH